MSPLRVIVPASLVSIAAAVLATACGGEGNPVNPCARGASTSTTATTTGGGGGAGGEGGGKVDAGAPRRIVETRNPFGSTKGNLMVDGDFELSVQSSPGGQVGWRVFSDSGSAELGFKVETGGLCRTGLRCAVLEKNVIFFGRGTAAPDDAPHVATMWSKPPQGMACNDVMTAVLVACSTAGGQKKLTAQTDAPGEDGWCEYSATISGRDAAVCIYLTSKLEGDATALLDSATLEPDTGNMAKAYEAWVPPADFVASLDATRDYIRRTTRFGRPSSPRDDRPGP